MKDFKEDQQRLKEEKIRKLESKQSEKEKKETTKANKTIEATNRVVQYGGVWTSGDIIDDNIRKYRSEGWSQTQIQQAVYCQIVYHRDVTKAKGPRELYQKTSKQKQKPLPVLIDNLKQILQVNDIQEEGNERGLRYLPMSEVQDRVETNKRAMVAKLKKERIQRQVQQQKAQASRYVENIELLVGKHVQHLCREPGEDAVWCHATVTGIYKCTANVRKTEYTLQYDTCPDDTWNFPLIMDLTKGDLLVDEDCNA